MEHPLLPVLRFRLGSFALGAADARVLPGTAHLHLAFAGGRTGG